MEVKILDAGELRDKLSVLEFAAVDEAKTQYQWRRIRLAWAKAEYTRRLAIYSNSGIGGREVRFAIRRQGITLRNAIRWGDWFVLLTSVEPLGIGHLVVTGAVVTPVECRGNVHKETPGPTFPAVLTEKYVGHAQEEPMATNTLTYVLVTPKEIDLQVGGLVEINGVPYPVQTLHDLDPDKREYELSRKVDL